MTVNTLGWLVIETESDTGMYCHAWKLTWDEHILDTVGRLSKNYKLKGWTVCRTKREAYAMVESIRRDYKNRGVYAF